MEWREKHKQQELERLQAKSKEQLIEEVFMLQEALRQHKGKSFEIVNKMSNFLKGFSESVKDDKVKVCARCVWRADQIYKEAEQYITSVFEDTGKMLEARKLEEK